MLKFEEHYQTMRFYLQMPMPFVNLQSILAGKATPTKAERSRLDRQLSADLHA